MVYVSFVETNYWTHVILYNFSLQDSPKITKFGIFATNFFGTYKLGHICGIGKRTHQGTKYQSFKPIGVKIQISYHLQVSPKIVFQLGFETCVLGKKFIYDASKIKIE